MEFPEQNLYYKGVALTVAVPRPPPQIFAKDFCKKSFNKSLIKMCILCAPPMVGTI